MAEGTREGYREVVIPDRATAIVGWRAWESGSDGTLQSTAIGSSWPTQQPIHAECKRGGMFNIYSWISWPSAQPSESKPMIKQSEPEKHEPPVMECSCGVYATKTLSYLISRGFDSTHVYGKVALWGRVIEHDEGYRAEYAYPVEVFVPKRLSDRAGAISEKYGIKTIVSTMLDWQRRKHTSWKVMRRMLKGLAALALLALLIIGITALIDLVQKNDAVLGVLIGLGVLLFALFVGSGIEGAV